MGFVLLYKYISDHKLFSALMFPPLKGIWKSFVEDRDATVLNLVSSIKLLIPSVAITLAIALGLGVLVGMNSKLRKNLTSYYLCIQLCTIHSVVTICSIVITYILVGISHLNCVRNSMGNIICDGYRYSGY